MSNEDKPIYAFVDSQNLHLGVKSQGWELDYARFRIYLKDSYKVEKAFLFLGYISKQEPMYENLRNSGYILIFKPVLEKVSNNEIIIKGNVDAELVLHTMIEYQNYRKAVIVSGDGDFHCLVEYLHKNNKLAKIVVPNMKYSSLLRRFGDYVTVVTMFRNKVEKRK